jgi:hypothetical protein
MVLSKYIWDLYKESKQGKETIDFFEYHNVFWNDVKVINKYNPIYGKWIEKRDYESIMEQIGDSSLDRNPCFDFKDFSEVRKEFETCLDEGIYFIFDNDEKRYVIDPKDYAIFLNLHIVMSFYFYAIAYEYAFPYLFTYRFFDLNKIADTFNIELPKLPKKSDYRSRCMYYIELCEVFYKFRIENNLTPNELCAFLYDFAPNYVNNEKTEISKPTQAWFIGGLISEEERLEEVKFWQANPETKKGDILVHYETSPISAITHIWIAQTDGVVDPFFYYYANSYIGDGIEIPYITLKELESDEYFSKHPLIRKKFQGVNGWAISNDDYSHLLQLIRSKGFDTSVLPTLQAPEPPQGIELHNERDVEVKLLEYYLNQIGYSENKDFIRQLPIKAGRGNRIYPDYALHYDNKRGYEKAKILIEAKYHLKNNKEIEDAFKQARSYANLLESEKIILCDKFGLIIYLKKGSFDRYNYEKVYWNDLQNPDVYNKFVNILKK